MPNYVNRFPDYPEIILAIDQCLAQLTQAEKNAVLVLILNTSIAGGFHGVWVKKIGGDTWRKIGSF
ncbi:MAG: hypothetical protein ABW080_00055 [Candidatus Thiodiazotropha sp.]